MRSDAVTAVAVGLLLAAAPAAAGRPRLSLGPVQGDPAVAVPTQLAELLCGTHDCVLWKQVSTRGALDLSKARALGVEGILTGAVEASPGGKKAKLSLFTTSTRPARTWTFPLTSAGRLTTGAARQLEQDLDQHLRPPLAASASPPPAPAAVVATPPPAEAAPPATAPPAGPPAPAPAPASIAPGDRPPLVAGEVGAFALSRRLTYGGTSASSATLLGFDAAGLAGPAVALELFPLAHGASRGLGGIGLRAAVEGSIGLKTESPTGEALPTQFTRIEIGACWRAPPLTGLLLVLVPEVAWVSQRLTVSPSIPGLPDSELSGVRVRLSAEARVSSRITVLAGLGWVRWQTARDLIEGDPAFFPGSSAAELEGELGAGVAIWGPLSLRLLGLYRSTSYTLDPDPTGTYAATSADDRYLGFRAVLRGAW
jgi:hypothetical protein